MIKRLKKYDKGKSVSLQACERESRGPGLCRDSSTAEWQRAPFLRSERQASGPRSQ